MRFKVLNTHQCKSFQMVYYWPWLVQWMQRLPLKTKLNLHAEGPLCQLIKKFIPHPSGCPGHKFQMKCWWTKFSTFHLKFVWHRRCVWYFQNFITVKYWQRGLSAIDLGSYVASKLCIHRTDLDRQYTVWKPLLWGMFMAINLVELFFNISKNIQFYAKTGFLK